MFGFLVDLAGLSVIVGGGAIALAVLLVRGYYRWRLWLARRDVRREAVKMPEHRRLAIYFRAIERGADPDELADLLSLSSDESELDDETLDRAIAFEERGVMEDMLGGTCEACGRDRGEADLVLRPDARLLCVDCLVGARVE